MSIPDLVILAILLIAVILALRKIYRTRKNGGACCADCSACSEACRSAKARRETGQNKE